MVLGIDLFECRAFIIHAEPHGSEQKSETELSVQRHSEPYYEAFQKNEV